MDIEFLLDKEKRENMSIFRTLKLASFMDLVNPKVIVGKSNFDGIVVLLTFYSNGREKLIDYSKNLIMNKTDYFELFDLCVLNELDKYDLYRIWHFMDDLDSFKMKNFFLLFSNEMLLDLGKNYPYLLDKYDENGMNKRNYTLFSDNLFLTSFDYANEPFSETRKRIDKFTMNPMSEDEAICYVEKKKRYIYFDEEFGGFLFRLFSDFVVPEEEKNYYRKIVITNVTRMQLSIRLVYIINMPHQFV